MKQVLFVIALGIASIAPALAAPANHGGGTMSGGSHSMGDGPIFHVHPGDPASGYSDGRLTHGGDYPYQDIYKYPAARHCYWQQSRKVCTSQ